MYSVSRFTVSRGTYIRELDRCRPTRHPSANRRQPGGNLFLGSLQIFFPSRCPLVMVKVVCCCDSDSRTHCQCHGPTSVRLLAPWSQALRSTLSRVVSSYRNQMGWVGVQSTASGITGVGVSRRLGVGDVGVLDPKEIEESHTFLPHLSSRNINLVG